MNKIKCLLGGPGHAIPKLDVTVKLAENEQQYRTILRDVLKRRFTNIILDLEPPEVMLMLKMALQLGMINSSYNFVLTTLVRQVLKNTKKNEKLTKIFPLFNMFFFSRTLAPSI